MAGATMVPPGRQHQRTVSDQQKRRELALQHQKQDRRDLQHHARQLAYVEQQHEVGIEDAESSPVSEHQALLEGARLKGLRAREFYSQQLMMPEWMVDIPPYLKKDWFIMPRPEGQRCLVISANGVTLSRQRNGRILHSFSSALPNGARTKKVAAGSHVYWHQFKSSDCKHLFTMFFQSPKSLKMCSCM